MFKPECAEHSRSTFCSASLCHVERLRTNRLPDNYVRYHYKPWINWVSVDGIWATESWMWGESVALRWARDLVGLTELVNKFGEQVGLLPPLLVDLADEGVVVVRNPFHMPSEHIEHFDLTFRAAQKPRPKFAHERRCHAPGDDTCPRSKPFAELVRRNVLNQ